MYKNKENLNKNMNPILLYAAQQQASHLVVRTMYINNPTKLFQHRKINKDKEEQKINNQKYYSK